MFEDDSYFYLIEMKYKSDPIEAILDLDRKAPLYAAQQGVDPSKIKEVILIDKEGYEKRKEEIEYHKSKREIQVLIYIAEDILKGSERTASVQEPRSSEVEDIERLFQGYTPHVKASLSLLKDSTNESVILGRRLEDQKKYNNEGTLYIGRICEKTEGYFGCKVLLDAIQPHKVFVCGKTGSGKSYTIGVIAEELASLNFNIGVVIVDPMGVFWSMKFPRKEKESNLLADWQLSPKGFSNVKVFVPIGFYDHVPEETRNVVFAIRPNELTPEDWCNTFGIDIYQSPQGTLLIEVIQYLKKGYTAEIDDNPRIIPPKENYTVDDMIECIKYCPDFAEKYRKESLRALIMHLDGAKHWGVFSTQATPVQNLSQANQISVVDISFLPEYSRALLVGIIARKILGERTRYVRHIKAAELKEKELERQNDIAEIPATWLMVDEAHILAPSKERTAASEPLVEYAKMGRTSNCALVLSTQQPGATDVRILSQVDILITHNLSFNDDISAYRNRLPGWVPAELLDQSFVRRLPVGVAVITDQSTSTERGFVMSVRPRVSEHAGRIVPPEAFRPKKTVAKEEKPIVEELKKPSEIGEVLLAAPPVPTLYIPTSLATDYLLRIIHYRLMEYLAPPSERRFIRHSAIVQSEVKRDILGTLLGHLIESSLKLDEVRDLEGTPALLMSHGRTRLAIAACLTESTTVIAYCVSAVQEQELVRFIEAINSSNKGTHR